MYSRPAIADPTEQRYLVVVVLIGGKRRAGKDTAARMFVDAMAEHDLTDGRWLVHKTNFADALKRRYARLNGVSLDRLLNDNKFKEQHRSGLIKMATVARSLDKGVFVNQLLEDLRLGTTPHHHLVVIADFRFPDELDSLQRFFLRKPQAQLRLLTVRVECDRETRRSHGWKYDASIDNSDSECLLDGVQPHCIADHGPAGTIPHALCWDVVLNNSATGTTLKMNESIFMCAFNTASIVFCADPPPADEPVRAWPEHNDSHESVFVHSQSPDARWELEGPIYPPAVVPRRTLRTPETSPRAEPLPIEARRIELHDVNITVSGAFILPSLASCPLFGCSP